MLPKLSSEPCKETFTFKCRILKIPDHKSIAMPILSQCLHWQGLAASVPTWYPRWRGQQWPGWPWPRHPCWLQWLGMPAVLAPPYQQYLCKLYTLCHNLTTAGPCPAWTHPAAASGSGSPPCNARKIRTKTQTWFNTINWEIPCT